MLTTYDKKYIEKHPEQLDELIADGSPLFIAGLIENGYAKEYYEQWKTDERQEVRAALARRGYYPDVFITDKEPYIRETVVAVYPEYCGRLLARSKKKHWKFVNQQINETTDLDFIKTFLDAPVPNKIDQTRLQAIRTMYSVRTSQPNTIEKTMSPLQLFQARSPFWATGLTLERIDVILDLYARFKKTDVIENFDKLVTLEYEPFRQLVWDLKANYRKEKKNAK
jgi:hypothetical protein